MIITIVNQKGGVGKTTSAINIGTYLSIMGKKVLLVDLDPQSNLSSGIGYTSKPTDDNGKGVSPLSTYDILIGNESAKNTLVLTQVDNLHLLPSSIQLAGAEIEMVSMISREMILKNALTDISKKYDYVLIDCPPSLGTLTVNALVASDNIFIPVQCEYFALEGLGQLLNTIKLIRSNLNNTLDIGGIILTMFDARTNLARQVTTEVKKYFKDKVFDTIIPRNVTLSEAPSYGKSVYHYDSNSPGARAYKRLTCEIIKRFG